jgi:hypothetical protein
MGRSLDCSSAASLYDLCLPFWLVRAVLAAGDEQRSGVRIGLNREKHLSLHITLKSGANHVVKVSRHRLPWSGGDSLIVVAVIGNGQCLRRDIPIGDPVPIEVSVEPDKVLQGDVDLERLFPDIRRALQATDIQLFWAYDAPEALQIDRWSGGWLLIPRTGGPR